MKADVTTTSYTTIEDNGTATQVDIKKTGTTTIAETTDLTIPTPTRKPKKKADLKKVPNQTEDTPKTKRRYFYEKTGNYVSYARAKQLGLVN